KTGENDVTHDLIHRDRWCARRSHVGPRAADTAPDGLCGGVRGGTASRFSPRLRRGGVTLAYPEAAGIARWRYRYRPDFASLASGAFSTWWQAAGNCASVIGGGGLGGSFGGFGCSTASENQ